MRNTGFAVWMALRIVRWASWIAFLAYSLAVVLNRPVYLNRFGTLLLSTEAWLYGLPLVAIAAGFLELMMRERGGIARPDYFRLMPPKIQNRPPRNSNQATRG